MGTKIESVATSRPRQQLVGKTSAIKLAEQAALASLERAGKGARDLDFLINAGIYRDNNLGEPALASIIQEDIGANPDPPVEGGHGTFSFDIANGAVGVLNGLQVLDGFISSGSVQLGMVVAADAAPSGHRDRRFPFAPVGGAVVL